MGDTGSESAPAHHGDGVAGSIRVLATAANLGDSKKIATEHLGRLLTLKEFIVELKMDRGFLEKTKGYWYWLGGEPGLSASGHCKIDYDSGTIAQVAEKEWNALPAAERAFAYRGHGPLSVSVEYYHGGGRLSVHANDRPSDAAPRVAFVQDGHFVVAPKYGNALYAVEAELKGLERTQKELSSKATALKEENARLEAEAKKIEDEVQAIELDLARLRKAAELLQGKE